MIQTECFIDGACGPFNPGGYMGWGWHIKTSAPVSFSDACGQHVANSNNVAEYLALNSLLEYLLANPGYTKFHILIKSDSQLLVKQMTGKWRIKNGLYAKEARKAAILASNFGNHKISFQWIPREENQLADDLSKAKLQEYFSQTLER